jgi:acetyltransferase
MDQNPLHLLLNPASIAIVGANNNPMKMGTMHALSILKDGYSGKLYPVHPKEKLVLGQKAYASVSELPEAPDLAMLIVPSGEIIRLMEELGTLGTRRVIIITAGFRETGAEGGRNEEKLREISEKYGIRFLGPNCMGIINTDISLNTTVMPLDMKTGRLSMISQSGTYVSQTLPYLGKRGIRFSKAISVGNSTSLSLTDALEYLGEDESTRAISLYIEGISDIERFLKTARKITPHKPVIAQYVGGSEAGARAGMSHTGAMAAPDHLYEGLFRQAGIIRVHSVEDLFGHGWALATQPRLKGRRVAVITNSGGPGSSMAHTCEQNGFEVPEFSEALQKKLEPMVPPHAPCKNPVDITFSMDIDILSHKIPDAVMASGEVDGMVLHGVMKSGFIKVAYPHLREMLNDTPVETVIDMIKVDFKKSMELPFKYGVPLACSSFFDRDDDFTVAYHESNIPVYDSPEKAARALASLLRYREVLERKIEAQRDVELPAPMEEATAIIRRAVEEGHASLDEYSSKRLLNCYGIPVSDERLIRKESELEDAINSVGLPVAMKACAPEFTHKTGLGLIYLGLKSVDECVKSFRKIQLSAGKKVPVLVSAMVNGDREFMSGFLRHPVFGGVVVYGLGGIFTEAYSDTAFRLAPFTQEDALHMVSDIRMKSLLGDIRGYRKVNLEVLASLVRTVGIIGTIHPEIREMDLNPIIIDGSNPVAVDALVMLR